ncbi:hypothetical protein FACS1894211_04090 [Clostridia bacterium]|nr:hypothetical protein FACS1894211_04090 [Clostridia bacterium]
MRGLAFHVTAAGTAITGNYGSGAQCSNVYICDNAVYGDGLSTKTLGISFSGGARTALGLSGLYITGNEVYDISMFGIRTCQEPNNLRHAFYDVHMDGNTVRDIGHIGMYMAGTTAGTKRNTINRNLVYNTGLDTKIHWVGDAAGIMAMAAAGMDIMFNESYGNKDTQSGNDAMAIDIDWYVDDIDVAYNHTYNNMGSGIGTMANLDCFIRDNRVENNEAATICRGQIYVGDYITPDYVPPKYYGVNNLKVTDNMIIGTPDNKGLFYADGKDGRWSGNEFTGNRVVYDGDSPNKINYVFVGPSISWYKFADNRYFAKSTSSFRCLDGTDSILINTEDGAAKYSGLPTFDAWSVRDLGSTFSVLSDAAPGKPSKPSATFENGELKLKWTNPADNFWRCNIYSVAGEDASFDYRDMLGKSDTASFTFEPEHNGIYYLVVQPESDCGVYGEALRLTVELK